MASIYLSYRPGDDDAAAGRLYDHLVERFGRDAVIWRESGGASSAPIASGLRDAVVMVALIGPRWLRGAGGASGGDMPPLAHPDDPVRLDLDAALARRLPIIPVLTQDATMPQAPYLPPMLRPFAGLTPILLRNDPDFRRDLERLSEVLGRYVAPLAATRGVRRLSRSAFALLAAVALLVIALSAVGVVFAARSGLGGVTGHTLATPTATPIVQRTLTLATVMRDPLTTMVQYSDITDTWHVNVQKQCSFANGGYQVVGAAKPNHISLCYAPSSAAAADQRLTITTRLTVDATPGGYYGVYFRSSDDSATNAYEFVITPSGRFGLLDSYTGKVLIQGSSAAIHTGLGATNTLMVDALGSRIGLFVNGKRVAHLDNSTYSVGRCGVLVEHGLTVVYTNFLLQRYQ